MRYKDIECAYCKKTFTEEDDVVVCPVCGTPHHRECWMSEKKCANEALHEEGFAWAFPEDKDPLKKLEEQKKAAHSPAPEFAFKNGEQVVECPQCGALNYGNDAFCMRCKAPLNGTGSEQPQGGFQQGGYMPPDPRQLAYDNQRLYGGLEPNIMIEGIPVAEYSDYIGGKAPGKIIRRLAGMERFDRKVSFNFAAFVFGPIWFFYRKMSKAGLMLLTLITLCSAISSVLLMTPANIQINKKILNTAKEMYSGELSVDEYYEKIRSAGEGIEDEDTIAIKLRLFGGELLSYAALGIRLAGALFADGIYKRKIKRDIEEARAACSDMDTYRRMLMEKGGTSAAGAVVGIAVTLAGAFIGEIPSLILVFLS